MAVNAVPVAGSVHQERPVTTFNGFAWLAVGLALVAWAVYVIGGAIYRRGKPRCARRVALCRRRAHLRRCSVRAGRAVHDAAERGGDPAALRRVPRHDARARPARHEPVLHAQEDLAPRAQPERRAAQGQRQARQSDRDRGRRRLARRRHREGALRRRRLRELREAAGRGRRAPPCVVLRVRRGPQPRRAETREPTLLASADIVVRRSSANCRRASTRPEWWSRKRASRTSPTRPRSRR